MAIRDFAICPRQSWRLDGFDYSDRRWYFVTSPTLRRQPLFGALAVDGVHLSDAGRIVDEEWQRTAVLRKDVMLDAFVIMPDHFHALLGLNAIWHEHQNTSLTALMNGFKAAVTSRIRRLADPPAWGIWQRSFHDSIIGSNAHFQAVRRYIAANPATAWYATRLPGSSLK
jgi:REP element-mobilizing transposase RayT